MDLPPSLQSRYRLDGHLGAGEFGTVLRCQDLKLDRPVALKLLDLDDPDLVARFEREARVTAGLQHPHIVRVFDHGVSVEGAPWIAYELVEGRDLSSEASPATEVLLAWARQGAEALSAVHAAGLVHRDVKPANFLVRSEDGHLVLVDFGIVRSSSKSTVATAEGLILGTPAYMAPELYQGQPPSPASDQYAWGASLFQVATGRSLFPENNPLQVMEAQKAFHPRRAVPDSLGPPGFVAALRRTLATNPADRFQDLADFWKALERGAPEVHLEPLATTAIDEPKEREGAATRALPVVATRTRAGGERTQDLAVSKPAKPWPRRLVYLALGVIGVGVGLGLTQAPGPAPLPPAPSKAAREMSPTERKEIQALVADFLAAEADFRVQFYGTPRAKHFELDPIFSRIERVERVKDRKHTELWKAYLSTLLKVLVRLEGFSHPDRVALLPWVYKRTNAILAFEAVHSSTRSLGEDHLMSFGLEEKDRTEFNIVGQANVFREQQGEIGLRHDEAIGATYAFLEDLDNAVPEPSSPLRALVETARRAVRSTRPGMTLNDSYARLPFPSDELETETDPEIRKQIQLQTDARNQKLLYSVLQEASELPSLQNPLEQRRAFERERAEQAKTWLPNLPEKIAPYQSGNWPQEFMGTALLVEARVLLWCQLDDPEAATARFRGRLKRYLKEIEKADFEVGGGVKKKLAALQQASKELARVGRSPGQDLIRELAVVEGRALTSTEKIALLKADAEAARAGP